MHNQVYIYISIHICIHIQLHVHTHVYIYVHTLIQSFWYSESDSNMASHLAVSFFVILIVGLSSATILDSRLDKSKIISGVYLKYEGSRTHSLRAYNIFFNYNFATFASNLDNMISDLQTYLSNFENTLTQSS